MPALTSQEYLLLRGLSLQPLQQVSVAASTPAGAHVEPGVLCAGPEVVLGCKVVTHLLPDDNAHPGGRGGRGGWH